MMLCHVSQNGSQRANTQWIMQRNRQVMLFRQIAFKPHMTTGLPGNFIPKSTQYFNQLRARYIAGQFSCLNDLFAHEMQTNHFRCFSFLKMTMYGIAHLLMQGGKIIRLGKNRFAECASDISTFWRFFD
jgi:hypothetical protein